MQFAKTRTRLLVGSWQPTGKKCPTGQLGSHPVVRSVKSFRKSCSGLSTKHLMMSDVPIVNSAGVSSRKLFIFTDAAWRMMTPVGVWAWYGMVALYVVNECVVRR